MLKLFAVLLAVFAPALLAVGCGSDQEADADVSDTGVAESASVEPGAAGSATENDSTTNTEVDSYYPVTLLTRSGEVTIETEPVSIVSLSPTATEMLFAIGAGGRVSAVDRYSNYPPEAPQGTLDGILPDLDELLSVRPDLVIAQDLAGDIVAGLAEADVPVILHPAAESLDDVYEQMRELGAATAQVDEAAVANGEIRSGVANVLAGLPQPDEPIRVFHEIDDSFYTTTSASFIGSIYELMGFVNIADPYDDGRGGGFPVIDGDTIIAADPTLIVLAKSQFLPYGIAEIKNRPGWEGVSAVVAGKIVEVDDDIASRWGPRVVELMQIVAAAVADG